LLLAGKSGRDFKLCVMRSGTRSALFLLNFSTYLKVGKGAESMHEPPSRSLSYI